MPKLSPYLFLLPTHSSSSPTHSSLLSPCAGEISSAGGVISMIWWLGVLLPCFIAGIGLLWARLFFIDIILVLVLLIWGRHLYSFSVLQMINRVMLDFFFSGRCWVEIFYSNQFIVLFQAIKSRHNLCYGLAALLFIISFCLLKKG